MIQGGIEGGLDDAFRFGDARPAPLDFRLRENDSSFAEVSIRQKEYGGTQSMKVERIKKGLVVINTGNGKGKTTAALGILFRAWGREMRVEMFQFIKHTGARFGETRAAEKIGIPIKAVGDGFTWLSKDIDVTKNLARRQWENCKNAIMSGEHDVIILDEFTYPLHYGWIPVQDAIETLKRKPQMLHVIITGRYAPKELIEFADLVTEMLEIKHPYSEQGIKAQPGLEF